MTPEGGRGQAMSAISTGIGARLIPTWLANVIVRVDGSRLLHPDPRWFGQLALSQYF